VGRADVADEWLGALPPAVPGPVEEQVLDQLVAQQLPGPEGGDEVELVDVGAQLEPGLGVIEVVGDRAVADEPADAAGVLALVGVEQRDDRAQLTRLPGFLSLPAGQDGPPERDRGGQRRDRREEDVQAPGADGVLLLLISPGADDARRRGGSYR
jgi:hypothetical protein